MERLLSLDYKVFHLVNSTLTHPVLDAFFPAITDLHKTTAFKWIFPLLVLVILWRAYSKKAVVIFIGALLCLGLADGFGSQVLKKNFERPRPFNTPNLVVHQRSPAASYSFPSNHAINTFAIAAYLTFFVPFLRPLLFSIAVLVAYSRVYNGVHFPSDVIVGGLLGSLIGFLIARLIFWSLSYRKRTSA
ncbi:MAG TPA: phosphatase PAP2 family protein [Pseudobdellovibrionaceae bacterium]|nr:phosphatase PAP2 family protein [Pseudobdellovibrionaceae bacterium]